MRPFLILFAGKAGTGKSTLASAVSEELSLPYVDYDTACQPFLSAIEKRAGLGDGDRYAFYRTWRKASYDTVLDIISENIRLGVSIVASAPFSEEIRDPAFPDKLRQSSGRDFRILLCYMAPDEETHLRMVRDRGSFRDEDFISDRKRFSETLKAEMPAWDPSSVMYLDSGVYEINKNLVITRVKALMEE